MTETLRQDADPTQRERLAKAMAAQRTGRLDEAAGLYNAILRAHPGHFDALHNLAVLFLQRADYVTALELLRRAHAVNPASPPLQLNIGNALRAAGHPEAAIASYDRAIALKADFAEPHNNRATVLRDLDRNEEALTSADRALAINPRYREAHLNRGHALDSLGRRDAAIASYRAAALHGADADEVRYYLAALGAEPPPPASPATYVVGLFDSYAERFDRSLTGLGYDVPRQLAKAVAMIRSGEVSDVADIGCGTGLAGVALRGMARRLVGVDLSAKMLAKAAERGVYDDLIRADAKEFLGAPTSGWDLIAAADVLVYIGDLSGIFAAARAALRSGGHFAFSVEEHVGPGYVIRPSRRYAHSRDYLAGLAAAHGFATRRATPLTIRSERGSDVPGFLIVLEAS